MAEAIAGRENIYGHGGKFRNQQQSWSAFGKKARLRREEQWEVPSGRADPEQSAVCRGWHVDEVCILQRYLKHQRLSVAVEAAPKAAEI